MSDAPGATVSRRELVAVAVLLLAVAALSLGSHIANGGFYYDDWANAARTHFSPEGDGFFNAIESFAGFTAYRPTLVLYLPITHEILGSHPWLHLAWAATLGALAAWCLFAVLRTLGMETVHAAAVAVLALLFPYADSTRLWSTSSVVQVSISLYLLGVWVALSGLRAQGRRSVKLHAGAVALFALSLCTYEITAAAIALTGLVYLTQAPWRRVIGRWGVDVGLVLASTIFIVSTTQNESMSLSDQIHHARLIAREGLSVIAVAAQPFGSLSPWLMVAALALLTAAALVVARTLPSGDPLRSALVRWVAFGTGGLVLAGAGWIVFAPAHWYYTPTTIGLANRVNVLSGLGIVLLVYAAFAVIGLLARRFVGPLRDHWIVVPIAAACVLAAGYLQFLTVDKRNWEDSHELQAQLLASLKSHLPDPVHGATVFTFNWPGYASAGIPIFAAPWDLNGAIKVQWHDRSLAALPIIEGSTIACAPTGVVVDGPGGEGMPVRRYGTAYLFDVATGNLAQPRNRAECTNVAPSFKPGPVNAT